HPRRAARRGHRDRGHPRGASLEARAMSPARPRRGSRGGGGRAAPPRGRAPTAPREVRPRAESDGRFRLVSEFTPQGDQPAAIDALTEGVLRGDRHQVLLGVTGSGKSFTVACVVERLQRPTLVMAPNKTLAAQLYSELKALFPYNAVEYFVSYYDYYQPEAYIPSTDTYIEKDSSINDE